MELQALVFDVFGTVTDWRGTIIAEGAQLNRARNLTVDWAVFADAWRAEYRPSMQRVMSGAQPWMSLDGLHLESLRRLLIQFGVSELSEPEIKRLNLVWHRLIPWPDAIPGLAKMRQRFTIATLSNGNVALLVNMSKHAGLAWDCILSAELVQAYKPDPRVYRSVAKFLGLDPRQIAMVAAHPEDLRAAAAQGLRTAYVSRPLEHGPDKPHQDPPAGEFDLHSTDFLDLAGQLSLLQS